MLRASALLLLTLLACGRAAVVQAPLDAGGAPDAGAPLDAGAPDSGAPDAGAPDAGEPGDAGAPDAGPDAGPPDAGPPLTTARVIFHLHSAISHDACDGHGSAGGALATLDQDCLDQLEAALCSQRIDVAFLTDHPAYMDSKSIEDDSLLRGRGETALRDAAGHVVGSQLSCPGGRTVLLAPGWESTHTLPLGLTTLDLDPGTFGTATTGTTSLADDQAALAAVHAAGGLYFTAHSEEDDLPLSRLRELQTDGMEWYNVHGNILALMGDVVGGNVDLAHVKDLASALGGLEPFLEGGNASADLVYLQLLDAKFPEAGLQKWFDVLATRPIVGGLGSDVHRNVSVKPLCKGAVALAACQAAASAVPNLLTALAAGGQLMLSDGERIDSYARVLRWLNNRVLVHGPGLDEARAALGHGRSYGVFAVLGEPGVFSFQTATSAGLLELGDTGPAAGAVLRVRLPDRPAPDLGPQWTPADAARSELHALLWRTTASGQQLAAEWHGFGSSVELPAPGPGRYSLEVRLVPRHLEQLLGKASALAGHEFRWILTNAIELQ